MTRMAVAVALLVATTGCFSLFPRVPDAPPKPIACGHVDDTLVLSDGRRCEVLYDKCPPDGDTRWRPVSFRCDPPTSRAPVTVPAPSDLHL